MSLEIWEHTSVTIIAAADGSALGNPGPAGWGWYVDADRWACGGWPHGTNNMGELTAVVDLLQQTAAAEEDLLVYCDSTYVINSITKWMPGWKRKNWRKGDGKPVQNVEIMKSLDAALQGRAVRFEWVKGHAGHDLNEQADRLATSASLAYSQGGQVDAGPGFGLVRASDPHIDPHAGYAPTPRPEPEADLFSIAAPDNEAADPASDEARVTKLERDLLTDSVRSDPATVAGLLHPDWTQVDPTGRRWTRDALLASVEPLDQAVSLDLVSLNRVAESAILLVCRLVSDRSAALSSSLWVREAGDWRQLFRQSTTEA